MAYNVTLGISMVLFPKEKNAAEPTANSRSSSYLFHTLTSSEHREGILFLILSI
mgnify:CR=1 FL=1